MTLARVFVSGCLGDNPIRFDATGVAVEHEIWTRWHDEGRVVSFCPELAAGFGIPRAPAEIVGGSARDVLSGRAHVLEDNGRDVTDLFLTGARLAAERAAAAGARVAVLTDGSPSCGSTYVFAGAFDGDTAPGSGVVAELLREVGIEVFAESQLDAADVVLRRLDADGAGT